jgi:hypothetical protein
MMGLEAFKPTPRFLRATTRQLKLRIVNRLIAACCFGILLTWLAFVLAMPKPVPHPHDAHVIVKETEQISFQREGDMVIATFVDGTICIHDKREIEPKCHSAVPQVEVK